MYNDALKYIVDEYGNIAVFSPTATHNSVARQMHGKPVGAGFVMFTPPTRDTDMDINCYGESMSLDLKSREVTDEIIIRKKLFNFAD